MSDYQTLDAKSQGNVTVASLSFEPTSFDCLEVLATDMQDIVDAHPSRHLVVSFAQVSIICSDSIGVLLRTRQTLGARGSRMCLCCMAPDVRKVFKLLNLEGTLFKIFETEEDAIASLEAS